MVIPGNVYVIMMPKDIPESRIHGKIAPLKNYFPAPKPPSNLLYHNTFNSLKKYAPPPLCLNILVYGFTPCSRIMYANH